MKLALDTDDFLTNYWQRKPLLIRQGVPDFVPPLGPDDLAGLALEATVESRIIETRKDQWLTQHGPFLENDFNRKAPWTLLVQAVDHYIPEVSALRLLVDFLPQWRVDDVMVSYAVDGGSVGPHYDNYDVFLLQGSGQRRWRLGQSCDASSELLEHDDLRILKEFAQESEYLLQCGDILYVPPGVAHWGIAEGECTTFSIGFRAPRVNDIVSRWADTLLAELDPELFYRDPGLAPVTRPGEIQQQDLKRAQAIVHEIVTQKLADHWFGELVTEPRYDTQRLDADELEDEAQSLLEDSAQIHLLANAKLAWQQNPDDVRVFANGDSLAWSPNTLPLLLEICKQRALSVAQTKRAVADNENRALLRFLLQAGCIYVEC